MSSLEYTAYPGWGQLMYDNGGYSQTVRVGDTVQASGQGGWNPSLSTLEELGTAFPSDLKAEIAQAFANVDIALKHAGVKDGCKQVFRVNSYHTTPLDPDLFVTMKEQFEKWIGPGHKPIWTEIGVRELGAPDMRVEIEVTAYDPSK